MLLSVFFRLLRFLITSIICSLPIYLGYLGVISDNGILFISFVAFVVIMGIDAYRFSFTFWERKHYSLGLLLPLGIYIVMGFLIWLAFPPIVFNRIFLPLRFTLAFGMRTIVSIVIVSVIVIVTVTVLRFLGAKKGRAYSNKFIEIKEKI